MGTISAIIPCYNAGPFLSQAIESVAGQTRPPDEVILVDDCSTDESAAIAERYGVKYIKTEVNSGEAATRNVGLDIAKGELIAWLDADDYWDHNHCEIVSQLVEEHQDAGVGFSGVRFFGEKQGCWLPRLPEGEPVSAFWECFRRTIVPSNSAITPRSALLEIGGFDETVGLAPDFDLWLRLSLRYRFICTRQITSNYRWHGTQISQHPEKQWRSIYEARRRLLCMIREEGDTELVKEVEQRMLEIWDEDLGSAWHDRQMSHLRFFLSMREMVPNSTIIRQKWKRRASLPNCILRAWDRLPRSIRNSICRQETKQR